MTAVRGVGGSALAGRIGSYPQVVRRIVHTIRTEVAGDEAARFPIDIFNILKNVFF